VPSRGLSLLIDRLDAIQRDVEELAAPGDERWRTKTQLAAHLVISSRWIDYRVAEGLPRRKLAGGHKFRVSEVEHWLRAHGYLEEEGQK